MQEHFHSGPQNEHVILVSIIARDFTQCVHTLWDSHNHSVYFCHFFFIFTSFLFSFSLSLSLFLSIFLPPFCPSHYPLLCHSTFPSLFSVCVYVCVCVLAAWVEVHTNCCCSYPSTSPSSWSPLRWDLQTSLQDGSSWQRKWSRYVFGCTFFDDFFCLFVYLFVFPLLFHCSVPEGQKVFPAKYPQEVESVTAKVQD